MKGSPKGYLASTGQTRCPVVGVNTVYHRHVRRLCFLGIGTVPEIVVRIQGIKWASDM